MTKNELAEGWLKSLREDEPGEWNIEEEDMILLAEALAVYLRGSEGHIPSVVIDGVAFVPRKEVNFPATLNLDLHNMVAVA